MKSRLYRNTYERLFQGICLSRYIKTDKSKHLKILFQIYEKNTRIDLSIVIFFQFILKEKNIGDMILI